MFIPSNPSLILSEAIEKDLNNTQASYNKYTEDFAPYREYIFFSKQFYNICKNQSSVIS